ncbi:PstS family phosphate ABC transporter substrate-binding protein [Pelomonas sp. KK5]|uniref:PstS family phosphate ABC transporter substrate-binding protein n=1 Tax=Pelomonas sp. KK5 TaxID=1855730 RepID=UPI00097C7CD5|nr:substrate-binding domain-containing protein [Pelomonas sp. KK5]
MKRRQIAAVLACAALLGHLRVSAIDVVPPPFQQRDAVEGVVRVWAHPQMGELLQRWQAAFRAEHPGVRFVNDLRGSDVAMAGLYTGQADIALIGREARASEVKAFEWIYRFRPQRIELMAGSVDRPGRSPALQVVVHRDNPLARLTLQQLDALFSHERKRGAAASPTSWGQLGLRGAWAARPIQLYTFDTESGSGRFFRESALMDSRQLNWLQIHEIAEARTSGGDSAGERILQALRSDRYGLAVASGPLPPGLKALPLSAMADAAALKATDRGYPLARGVYAYLNHKPDTPLDAPTAAFLRYILSARGQMEIGAADGFQPLLPAIATGESQQLR